MKRDESEFVERMGLLMEQLGGPRTMGRIYGWLMICDPPHRSITELAAELAVSKASVSTTARMLQDAGMIERFPTADRQHRYQVTQGGWTHVLRVQLAGMRAGLDTLEYGLSVVGADRTEQRARLEETRDFFAFLDADAKDFIRRWEKHRREK